MTDDEAKELARLEAAATPGPWTPDEDDDLMVPPSDPSDTRPMVSIVGCRAGGEQGSADAAFIAAARNALPRLLAEREALRSLLREARMVVGDVAGMSPSLNELRERIDQAIGGGNWTEDGRTAMGLAPFAFREQLAYGIVLQDATVGAAAVAHYIAQTDPRIRERVAGVVRPGMTTREMNAALDKLWREMKAEDEAGEASGQQDDEERSTSKP